MSDIIIDGETREFNGLEFVYYQGKWFNKRNTYADVGDLIYVEEIYSSVGLLDFSGGEVRAVITTGYGKPTYFNKDINGLTYAFIEHGDRFYPLEEAEINTQHRLNYRFLGKALSELYEESIELGDEVSRPLTVDTSGISYELPEKALQALSSLYDLAELGVHSADLTVIASEILTAYPLQVSKSGGIKRRVTDFGEVEDD